MRRWATLLTVIAALGMVAVDYAAIYRELLVIFGPGATMIKASQVVVLYQLSGILKRVVLGVSLVAAIMTVWPETSGDSSVPSADPAL